MTGQPSLYTNDDVKTLEGYLWLRNIPLSTTLAVVSCFCLSRPRACVYACQDDAASSECISSYGDSMRYLNRTVAYDGGTVQGIAVYPVCNKTCHWNFTKWLRMKSNLLPLFHKGLAMALSLDWDLPSLCDDIYYLGAQKVWIDSNNQ